MMLVRDLMSGDPKTWKSEVLENYVNPEDIPLIQSLAINQEYQRDKYCWSYTKNEMYTVKSRYLVARNFLNKEMVETQGEPSITKLQAFAWKMLGSKSVTTESMSENP